MKQRSFRFRVKKSMLFRSIASDVFFQSLEEKKTSFCCVFDQSTTAGQIERIL
jgi:hypothetical protein